MLLRANVLSKGHSGITEVTLQRLLVELNADCLPRIPCQGTVGASGDLAPLSHLALGLMGEGEMRDPRDGAFKDSAVVLAAHGLERIVLGAKEGLALINGTQLITALGAEALSRSQNAAFTADVACALTLEVLKGTSNAFHPCIHMVRRHGGQTAVARRLRSLLRLPSGRASELHRSHGYKDRVQDAYTLRCAPQVHGIVLDTIAFARSIIEVEMNSATDNPMIFRGSPDIRRWEQVSLCCCCCCFLFFFVFLFFPAWVDCI